MREAASTLLTQTRANLSRGKRVELQEDVIVPLNRPGNIASQNYEQKNLYKKGITWSVCRHTGDPRNRSRILLEPGWPVPTFRYRQPRLGRWYRYGSGVVPLSQFVWRFCRPTFLWTQDRDEEVSDSVARSLSSQHEPLSQYRIRSWAQLNVRCATVVPVYA